MGVGSKVARGPSGGAEKIFEIYDFRMPRKPVLAAAAAAAAAAASRVKPFCTGTPFVHKLLVN